MAEHSFIYAPNCPRCRRVADFLARWTGGRLRCLPYSSDALGLHPDLSFVRASKAPQLVLANGYLCEGAEALANALALRPGFKFLSFLYYLPPFKQAGQALYWLFKARPAGCEACGD